MISKARLEFPDSLKGLAVLLMIQVHITELFVRNENYESFFGKTSLFLGGIPAAPVFMLAMGYFLAYGKKSPSKIAWRGFRLFFGGILLNVGLNAHLLYNILFKGWQFNAWHYIFGVDILPLAGLSLVFIAFINRVLPSKTLIYFGLAIAAALVSEFFHPLQFEENTFKYILAFFIGGTSFAYFPLFPWIAYPLLGYGFNKLLLQMPEIKFRNVKYFAAAGLTGLFLLVTINFGFNISVNLTAYYHHNSMFFIWAVAFAAFWIYLLYLLEFYLNNSLFFIFLRFLGKNVTAIYVVQWLIIGNIATKLFKTQSLIEWFFWVVGITLISSVLTYIWLKLKSKIASKN